jgi:hypothetical protein
MEILLTGKAAMATRTTARPFLALMVDVLIYTVASSTERRNIVIPDAPPTVI